MYQWKKPREDDTAAHCKLPNLMETTQDTTPPTTQVPRGIAHKTRTSARLLKKAEKEQTSIEQRQKKMPEDAYDSPNDEGSDMDTHEE